MGANIEMASDEFSTPWLILDDKSPEEEARATDEQRTAAWSATLGGHSLGGEIVFSFFGRESARINAAAIDLGSNISDESAKDIEIWASSAASPDKGFTKITAVSLKHQSGSQTVTFSPIETRYVKIRLLSSYGPASTAEISRVKVFEATGAGYISLVDRNPDLAALLRGDPMEAVFKTPTAPSGDAATGGSTDKPLAGAACESGVAELPAAHNQSRSVLVLNGHGGGDPWFAKVPDGPEFNRVINGVSFQRIPAECARAAKLLGSEGIDTVVFSEVCDIKTRVPTEFKAALLAWVAQGHKLIIQDSDECGGDYPPPDYSFLPFRFATSNPGPRGAPGHQLFIVEENRLGRNSDVRDPSYVDIDSWVKDSHNQLGDANVITQYGQWCGQLFGLNVTGESGFLEAYAHIGRGLIIYDGLDRDDLSIDALGYIQTTDNELKQPFNPDGLPCSSKIGNFLLTTDQTLRSQAMTPGQTYTYPLTLLSNLGYKGTLNMSATSAPPDPSLGFHFDSATIDLAGASRSRLVVSTTGETATVPHTLAIRGTDHAGNSSALCLQWTVTVPTAESIKADLDKNGRAVLYINFDFDKAIIKPESGPTVNEVIRMLKQSPDLQLSINGYTDNVGTHEYNVTLSQARAAAVVDALAKAGIAADRLSSAGFGDSAPIADNDTPEGRAKNRRVELIKR
jgi:hypothetical protein